MKIFVINLSSATEKRETMKNTLDQYTKEYIFFEAIDGKNVKDTEYTINLDWFNPCGNNHTTCGEIGCALSHYSIWKMMIDENIEQALILEDDIVINNPDFISIIEKIPINMYDLIYVGRKKTTDIKEEQAIDIHSSLVKPTFSYWTCAYVLTLSGAKKLCRVDYLNNITPIDEYMPYMACVGNHINSEAQTRLDKYYGHLKKAAGKFNTYAFEPPLIEPNNQAFYHSSTFHSSFCNQFRDDVLCITVATENNDCVKRYRNSCFKYGFNPIILGLDDKWTGGNMIAGQGGGQKINLLKLYLKDISSNKLVVFTDSYDVICNDNVNVMIETYKSKFKNKIVFGAEIDCWPDKSLIDKYPISNVENKYLNSGNFIGWSDDIKKIIELPINNNDDDQLYYTHRFLESLNEKIDTKIVLDYYNDLFFCLNKAINCYQIHKNMSYVFINSSHIKKRPIFIHGNGPSSIKRELNYISNYTCEGYNNIYGYNTLNSKNQLPKLLIVYDELFSPSQEFISGLINLDYPHDLLEIIYIYEETPNKSISSYFKSIEHIKKTSYYFSVITKIVETKNVDYIFYLNSHAVLTNSKTLQLLVNLDKNVCGPLLKESNCLFSNFWGDVDSNNNYYKRSKNYIDILNQKEKSCWNIAYIWYAVLIKKKLFTFDMFNNNIDKGNGVDMAFCYNLRKQNIFMYVLNTEKFGYYYKDLNNINLNSYKIDKTQWEKKYINNDFRESINIYEEICTNVHKIMMFTPKFCNEIIQKAEQNGNWSIGGESYFDKRIGAKENHPTQDIHLKEIDLEEMWKFIIENYISPFVYKIYKYNSKNINISFVVKYSMMGQKELKPHHDSSAFTVNICLNNDFEGGGCEFIHQKTKVVNKDIGSLIIHPGRLTHYHQGLPITRGTRYILVSFVN
tara:strand:- start:3688 stop:6402 length:2715 start_codon:yes stop_codon:yes gene_type:complete